MNLCDSYVIELKTTKDPEPYLFLVYAEETKEYVKRAIKESQNDFLFESACDLIEYVCDAYGFRYEDFTPDIRIGC